jgi:hypothetical protein
VEIAIDTFDSIKIVPVVSIEFARIDKFPPVVDVPAYIGEIVEVPAVIDDPMKTLPPIPTPPATTSAPEELDVLVALDDTLTGELVVTLVATMAN